MRYTGHGPPTTCESSGREVSNRDLSRISDYSRSDYLHLLGSQSAGGRGSHALHLRSEVVRSSSMTRSASRPSAPVEAAMQLHPSTLLSHPLHHQIRAQTNPHGRHAHVHGTAAVSAVLWIVAAPRSSTGVGAVVGSVYVGVVWDSRPGMVLCKQHGRTPRFSKQMGTKCIPLANSSSDHFVCKASSYPTGASERHQKVEVEQSSCSQVQRGQSGATYQVGVMSPLSLNDPNLGAL